MWLLGLLNYFTNSGRAFAKYRSPKQFPCMICELNLARYYSWERFAGGYAILETEDLLEWILPDSAN